MNRIENTRPREHTCNLDAVNSYQVRNRIWGRPGTLKGSLEVQKTVETGGDNSLHLQNKHRCNDRRIGKDWNYKDFTLRVCPFRFLCTRNIVNEIFRFSMDTMPTWLILRHIDVNIDIHQPCEYHVTTRSFRRVAAIPIIFFERLIVFAFARKPVLHIRVFRIT